MEFFIDTGNLDEIREAYSWGIVDGVTTNPSLVAKEGIDQKTLISNIAEIVDGPISGCCRNAKRGLRTGKNTRKCSDKVTNDKRWNDCLERIK